jgi:hypothetical protein
MRPEPWEALPPELAATLRPELGGLADEIVAAVRAEVPAYGEGELPPRLRIGVEEALRQFVELIERPGGRRRPARDVYVGLGRGEMRAGRGLDALLAAYRVGARVAWRRLAAVGGRAGLQPDTLYLLAEAIFAYIDELSAESAEGHAQEQSAAAGEAERRRRRLVALLLQSPPADAVAVRSAAEEAGWTLPRTLAVLAVHASEPRRALARLGAEAIASRVEDLDCAVVADPDAPGRRGQLERAIAARGPTAGSDAALAALGPTVAWEDARTSFTSARDALALAREGALEGAGDLVLAQDHAADIVLARERRLLGDLARELLGPLDGQTPAARSRLSETLLAWLRHQGRLDPVAAELGVHPQTVRYRLGRARDLLGSVVDDPDRRLELELALRSRWLDGRRAGGSKVGADGATRAR